MFDGLSLVIWFWGTVTYLDHWASDRFAASELAHQWQLSRSIFCGVIPPESTPATTTFPPPLLLSTPIPPPSATPDFRMTGHMAPLILFFYTFSLLLLITASLMLLKRLSTRSLSCRLAYPMMPTSPSSSLVGMNWELSVGDFPRKLRGLRSSRSKQGQQRRPALIARLLKEAQAANRKLSKERSTNSIFRDRQTKTLNSKLREIERLEAQLKTANDTIRDQTVTLDNQSGEIARLQTDVKNAADTNRNQRATLDRQSREIAILKTDVRDAKATTRETRTTANDLRSQRDQALTDLSDTKARLEKEVKATLEERTAKEDLWSQHEEATSISMGEIARLKKEVGRKAEEVKTQTNSRKKLGVELDRQVRQFAELKELHQVSTQDLDAKRLDLEKLRSDSTAAIDALERKNEEVEMEAKNAKAEAEKWRQHANNAEDAWQEKADEIEQLIEKLKEERDTHELEISQLLQQLEEAREARATTEPSDELVAQGMTGSGDRRTEAQSIADSEKAVASGAILGEEKQKQAAEIDHLGKKLVDVEEHTVVTRHHQLKLAKAVEARVIPEPSGEVVAQGMTGSGDRQTEAQPAAEADKAEASGVVKGKLDEGSEYWKGKDERKGEGEGKEKVKKEHHRGARRPNAGAELREEFKCLANNVEEVVSLFPEEESSLKKKNHRVRHRAKKRAKEPSSSMAGGDEDSSAVEAPRNGAATNEAAEFLAKLTKGNMGASRYAPSEAATRPEEEATPVAAVATPTATAAVAPLATAAVVSPATTAVVPPVAPSSKQWKGGMSMSTSMWAKKP